VACLLDPQFSSFVGKVEAILTEAVNEELLGGN